MLSNAVDQTGSIISERHHNFEVIKFPPYPVSSFFNDSPILYDYEPNNDLWHRLLEVL